MKYDEYMQVQWHLLCLGQTAERYKSFIDHMELEKDNMRIWGVGYTSDAVDLPFVFDKRYPISLNCIISGVKDALNEINAEIARVKKQAEEREVTV